MRRGCSGVADRIRSSCAAPGPGLSGKGGGGGGQRLNAADNEQLRARALSQESKLAGLNARLQDVQSELEQRDAAVGNEADQHRHEAAEQLQSERARWEASAAEAEQRAATEAERREARLVTALDHREREAGELLRLCAERDAALSQSHALAERCCDLLARVVSGWEATSRTALHHPNVLAPSMTERSASGRDGQHGEADRQTDRQTETEKAQSQHQHGLLIPVIRPASPGHVFPPEAVLGRQATTTVVWRPQQPGSPGHALALSSGHPVALWGASVAQHVAPQHVTLANPSSNGWPSAAYPSSNNGWASGQPPSPAAAATHQHPPPHSVPRHLAPLEVSLHGGQRPSSPPWTAPFRSNPPRTAPCQRWRRQAAPPPQTIVSRRRTLSFFIPAPKGRWS